MIKACLYEQYNTAHCFGQGHLEPRQNSRITNKQHYSIKSKRAATRRGYDNIFETFTNFLSIHTLLIRYIQANSIQMAVFKINYHFLLKTWNNIFKRQAVSYLKFLKWIIKSKLEKPKYWRSTKSFSFKIAIYQWYSLDLKAI